MSDQEIITPEALKRYASAMATLADFRRRFGRELDDSAIAELLVAERLDLKFPNKLNQSGYDLLGEDGVRYQVKCRAAGTQNVDLNNFDFDFVVLVNLSDRYDTAEMWRMSVAAARQLFAWRAKFRKYQSTQTRFKRNAEAV